LWIYDYETKEKEMNRKSVSISLKKENPGIKPQKEKNI